MNEDLRPEVQKIVEDPTVLWNGHFVTSSGKHTDYYWLKFRILERPELLLKLSVPIVERFRNIDYDVVVGPTLGGVFVSYEVARLAQKKVIVAERDPNNHSRFFRKPSILKSSSKVLIVDDVLMTGRSIRILLDAIRQVGAQIIGIAVLLDRSETTPVFEYPLFYTHRFKMSDFPSDNCPLCRQGVPISRPGGTN